MAGMWSNQSIIPTFDVSAKTAEPKMAFNFAHLLSAACGGAARRLRALRALFFLFFCLFHSVIFKNLPFLGARRQARPHFCITAARANQGIRRVKLT